MTPRPIDDGKRCHGDAISQASPAARFLYELSSVSRLAIVVLLVVAISAPACTGRTGAHATLAGGTTLVALGGIGIHDSTDHSLDRVSSQVTLGVGILLMMIGVAREIDPSDPDPGPSGTTTSRAHKPTAWAVLSSGVR
jgi:hypothetical protein